jgi:hypothetical protein
VNLCTCDHLSCWRQRHRCCSWYSKTFASTLTTKLTSLGIFTFALTSDSIGNRHALVGYNVVFICWIQCMYIGSCRAGIVVRRRRRCIAHQSILILILILIYISFRGAVATILLTNAAKDTGCFQKLSLLMFADEKLLSCLPFGSVFPKMFSKGCDMLVPLTASFTFQLFFQTACLSLTYSSNNKVPGENRETVGVSLNVCWEKIA